MARPGPGGARPGRAPLLAGALAVLTLAVTAAWLARPRGGGGPESATPAPASLQEPATAALPTPAVSMDASPRLPARAVEEEPRDPETAGLVHRFRGRVLDAARRPFAGARVELAAWPDPGASTTSDAHGRYELEARVGAEARSVHVLARDDEGHAGRSKQIRPWPPADEATLEVAPIVLLPGHRLLVHVREQGAGVPGARVRAILGSNLSGRVLEVPCDESGTALLEDLPVGPVSLTALAPLREGRALAHTPEDAEAVLELRPAGVLDVRVIDEATREGIPRARVVLVELHSVHAPGRGDGSLLADAGRLDQESVALREVASEQADEGGRVRFSGLFADARLRLRATAPGYPPLSLMGRDTTVPAGATLVEIPLQAVVQREVRWPVVAGEVPPPPEGAEVALRWGAGTGLPGEERPPIAPARMLGGTLVAPALAGGGFLIAAAPDGSLASLWVNEGASAGMETSFRRPRRIEVLVRDARGAPVRGARAAARNQGNNLLAEAGPTDAEGRTWIEGLHGGLANVHVLGPGQPRGGFGASVASVDLDRGDGRVEHVLPDAARAFLLVRIDGRPGLPSHFFLGGRSPVRVVAEDPDLGELELSIEGADPGVQLSVHMQAPGFLPAATTLVPPPDGSPARGELALQRAGVIVVEVDSGGARVQVLPERFDPEARTWKPDGRMRAGQGLRVPNGPGGTFVFPGAEPGRWRIVERESKRVSEEAELLPGQPDLRFRLEVSRAQWVAGRVEVPDPSDLARVRVLVEGSGAERDAYTPGMQLPTGASLQEDRFRVRIPGDRPVRILPWHPWLAPAEGSVLELTDGREDVVLRLVPGDELRLRMPGGWRARPPFGVRLARYAGEPVGEPLQWHHGPVLDGEARFGLPRGRWTLWVDEGGQRAPLVLRHVEVEGVVELAPVFEAGSAVRVRLAVPPGQDPPRIHVSATTLEGAPRYSRQVSSRGEREVVLVGLGPGRFQVRVGQAAGRDAVEWNVELDGTRDEVLDLRWK